jgi:hypothetical protein
MTQAPFVFRRQDRTGLSSIVLSATLLLSRSAHAQDMTAAGAQLLDAEGTALLNERQLAAACPKLEQSFRLKPGTGVLLRLALCQELSGKLASALASYLQAAERGQAAGNRQVVQLAQTRAATLQPRLSHLTVDLDPGASDIPELQLSCDGARLELTTLGAGLPLDPGAHVIQAVAPGRKRFEKSIVVSDEPRRYSITVTLPEEQPEVEPEAATGLPREAASTQRSAWSTQRSLALVAGGVGIAGVTAGTFLGLSVGSRMRRARASCSDGTSGCTDDALVLQEEARGYSLASTVAFCAGTAGILGGLALWLTAPQRSERPSDAQLRFVPAVSLGTAGIQAVGTW